MRSGEAHGARRISPVEVRRGPQRSDSRQLSSDRELAVEVRRGRRRRSRASDMKFNNPHLAGGEKKRQTSRKAEKHRLKEAGLSREPGNQKSKKTKTKRTKTPIYIYINLSLSLSLKIALDRKLLGALRQIQVAVEHHLFSEVN